MEKILKNEPYKVSILIPIYGVEKYIKRCAISLFEQTYSNLEFVFVNDSTCDGSIAILNETIKLYPKREQQVKHDSPFHPCWKSAARHAFLPLSSSISHTGH